MDLHGRHFMDAQQWVIVEVPLLHPPLLEADFAVERGGQTKDGTALHLGADRVRVDDRAAIDRADNAVDPELARVGYRDLRDVRGVAAEGLVDGDTPALTQRRRLAPARLVGDELQHPLDPRVLAEQA